MVALWRSTDNYTVQTAQTIIEEAQLYRKQRLITLLSQRRQIKRKHKEKYLTLPPKNYALRIQSYNFSQSLSSLGYSVLHITCTDYTNKTHIHKHVNYYVDAQFKDSDNNKDISTLTCWTSLNIVQKSSEFIQIQSFWNSPFFFRFFTQPDWNIVIEQSSTILQWGV